MLTDSNLFTGFALNVIVALIIVRGIYYPSKPDKNYVITFMAFNTLIFFVMSLLSSIEVSIGAGFGLFAIFSILRYRTDPMPPREITYLFILIGLPIINATLNSGIAWPTLLLVNVAVIAVLYVLERGWGFQYEESKRIVYDRIELIRAEDRDLLLADLRQRTGLPITRIEVGKLDFLRDSAEIKLFYPPTGDGWSNDTTTNDYEYNYDMTTNKLS
ncbi:MAG: DUF4956 domain-containing protein [Anaerolineae bacterium]|nr:DUF4956 domain-containing protein [Anaerolineae bacterium]MCO5189977.1 DUF4956 domain-containing protein [Anaerolineae bacterium]MCO5198210.1 DUF4956 domain-containing protein [Anaerolineae bacterium]MCO5205221.1 DUF4956 domain-containing protein [Anaerolineae bacterium]